MYTNFELSKDHPHHKYLYIHHFIKHYHHLLAFTSEQDGDHCRFSSEVGYLARVYDLKACLVQSRALH